MNDQTQSEVAQWGTEVTEQQSPSVFLNDNPELCNLYPYMLITKLGDPEKNTSTELSTFSEQSKWTQEVTPAFNELSRLLVADSPIYKILNIVTHDAEGVALKHSILKVVPVGDVVTENGSRDAIDIENVGLRLTFFNEELVNQTFADQTVAKATIESLVNFKVNEFGEFSVIESLSETLKGKLENNTIASVLAGETTYHKILKDFLLNPNLTTDQKILELNTIDEVYGFLQSDIIDARTKVANLFSDLRTYGSDKLNLSSLAQVRDILEHVLIRFSLEGHSGRTAPVSSKHILDTILKVKNGKQKQLDSIRPAPTSSGESLEPNLNRDAQILTATVSTDDLLDQEVSVYPNRIDGIISLRATGRIAFLPVFDLSYYPTKSKSGRKIPFDVLDSLYVALEQLLMRDTTCFNMDLSKPDFWEEDSISTKHRKIFQNNRISYVFKQEQDNKVRYWAQGRIVYCELNDVTKPIHKSDLGNSYTSEASSIEISEEESKAYCGSPNVLAFVGNGNKTSIIQEKPSLESLNTQVHCLIDSQFNFYTIESISHGEDTSYLELKSVRNGEIKEITLEEYLGTNTVKRSIGDVMVYANYTVIHNPQIADKPITVADA